MLALWAAMETVMQPTASSHRAATRAAGTGPWWHAEGLGTIRLQRGEVTVAGGGSWARKFLPPNIPL